MNKSYYRYQLQEIERAKQKQEYGDYLEALQKWEWFVTVTFARSRSSDQALKDVKYYLGNLERVAGKPIGWVLVSDFGRATGRFHVHVLVSGVGHVDRNVWLRKASGSFGRTTIDVFRPGGGASHYVASHALTDTGQLDFGGTALQTKPVGSAPLPPPIQSTAPAAGRSGAKPKPQSGIKLSIDGSARQNGPGYAWVQAGTGRKRIKKVTVLSHYQAVYKALLSGVKNLPEDSDAEIRCSSSVICKQFDGRWTARVPELRKLLRRIRKVILRRKLRVALKWLPSEENRAGRLL